MTILFALVMGAFVGWQMANIFKAIRDQISPKQRATMMRVAHFSTAVSVLTVVSVHLREIALRVAVFLSDYLGVWIIKYTSGECLHAFAGHLGTIAKVLYDYAALAHPVHPGLQLLAIYVFAQMLVFEYVFREKK